MPEPTATFLAKHELVNCRLRRARLGLAPASPRSKKISDDDLKQLVTDVAMKSGHAARLRTALPSAVRRRRRRRRHRRRRRRRRRLPRRDVARARRGARRRTRRRRTRRRTRRHAHHQYYIHVTTRMLRNAAMPGPLNDSGRGIKRNLVT
jgi:hypothetical protein